MDYKRIYNELMIKRKTILISGYTETHHIIPKSVGGSNDKSNLVCLTAREHFIAHLLLTKFYTEGTFEYYKMIHAFYMMLNAKSAGQERYISSKRYEYLKTAQSRVMSITQSGSNNSQHGTMWISNSKLRQSKKVSIYFTVTTDWFKGRVLNWNNHYTYRPCSVCDKIGCVSKLSKFCSDECKKSTYTFELDMYIDKFIEYYKEHKSINKALKLLGKSGTAGEYYYWAVRTIENCLDSEVKEIYNRNVK